MVVLKQSTPQGLEADHAEPLGKIMDEFKDVFPEDLPSGLPPDRDMPLVSI